MDLAARLACDRSRCESRCVNPPHQTSQSRHSLNSRASNSRVRFQNEVYPSSNGRSNTDGPVPACFFYAAEAEADVCAQHNLSSAQTSSAGRLWTQETRRSGPTLHRSELAQAPQLLDTSGLNFRPSRESTRTQIQSAAVMEGPLACPTCRKRPHEQACGNKVFAKAHCPC